MRPRSAFPSVAPPSQSKPERTRLVLRRHRVWRSATGRLRGLLLRGLDLDPITILNDLFRDHETSGWGKAAWVLFLVFVPFLTALIYLIARGGGMRDRAIKAQAEAKQHMDTYIQQQAHSSPADELHKLNDLKEKGALSAEEFDRAKARLLT